MRLVEGADFALGKTQVLNRQIDERKRRRKVIAARMPRRDGVLEAALRIATLPVLAFQLLGNAIAFDRRIAVLTGHSVAPEGSEGGYGGHAS